MKIEIESNGLEKLKITLKYAGKEYTEEWEHDNEYGGMFCNKSIVDKMIDMQEHEGLLEDVQDAIENIDIQEIASLADFEEEYE